MSVEPLSSEERDLASGAWRPIADDRRRAAEHRLAEHEERED